MDRPDFVIIPTQVLADARLQPLDRVLFGYIYWLTKLKHGRCTAGNLALAELCGASARGVQNSLTRLEQSGWVRRVFAPNNPMARVEVLCLVSFAAKLSSNDDKARANEDIQLSSNDDQNKSIYKKSIKKEPTKVGATPVRAKRADIDDIFSYWQEKTGIPITSRIKLNRYACANLLRKYTDQGLRRLIDGAADALEDQYAPRISDLISLQARVNDLLAWGRKRQSVRGGVAVVPDAPEMSDEEAAKILGVRR